MSGETEDSVSGWTIDTLRASVRQELQDLRFLLDERYATQTKALDAAFVAAEKAVATALSSAEKAVTKAETAAERRFESVNEFRAQLNDQAGTFMPRTEYQAKHEALEKQVDELTHRIARSEGSSSGKNAMYGWIVAAVGLVVAVIVAMNSFTGG